VDFIGRNFVGGSNRESNNVSAMPSYPRSTKTVGVVITSYGSLKSPASSCDQIARFIENVNQCVM
jgi:hypothetical protein